jgi:hypothetical protein
MGGGALHADKVRDHFLAPILHFGRETHPPSRENLLTDVLLMHLAITPFPIHRWAN